MALSGQKTVTSAGIPEKIRPASGIGEDLAGGYVMIRALPINTGYIYLGGEGVSAHTGLILAGGDAVVFMDISLFSNLWIDADKNGEGIAWIKLEV